MKKLSTSLIMMAAFATLISFNACKKKPKDADIKAAIETALKADPAASTASVSVEKGVATITGEFTDQATKDKLTSLVKGVKGVTDVVNNGVVSAPL
ncbi:MAG: BON domain-containing protein, partial [Chitinophagaceae bacterium]